jgi:hypothetical protein
MKVLKVIFIVVVVVAAVVALAVGAHWIAALIGGIGVLGVASNPKPGVKKIEEEARDETLKKDPGAVVDALDDRAKSGISAAERAGLDAASEALHRGPGDGGGPGGAG